MLGNEVRHRFDPRLCIRWRNAQACQGQCRQIIDVVADVGNMLQIGTTLKGESLQCATLILAAFADAHNADFFGKLIDERTILSGYEAQVQAGFTGPGEAHDVREGEFLILLPGGAPDK